MTDVEPQPPGQILYCRHEGTCTLRLVGDIRYTTGPSAIISRSLDEFLSRLLCEDSPEEIPTEVVVDLTETLAIDSTNLGLLARLANHCSRLERHPVMIVAGEDIPRTIQSVGFDRVFRVMTGTATPGEGAACEPIPSAPEQAEPSETLNLILNAHRRLIAMNEQNRDMFADAVELMEAELGESS